METQTVLLIQGLYYFVTAAWPLVHVRSFEAVTGPKLEHWLLNTVAMMILCSSFVFISAGLSPFRPGKETLILAFSNALGLVAIDIIYSLKNVIRKVYLLDAAAEGALIVLLVLSL